jgi:hypothetical protein
MVIGALPIDRTVLSLNSASISIVVEGGPPTLPPLTLPNASFGLSVAAGGMGLYRPNSYRFADPFLQGLLEDSMGNRLRDFDGRAQYLSQARQNAVDISNKIDNGEMTPYEGAKDAVLTRDKLTLSIRKTSTSPEGLRLAESIKPSAGLEATVADPASLEAKVAKFYAKYRDKFIGEGRDFTPDDVYREIVRSGGSPQLDATEWVLERMKVPLRTNAGSLGTINVGSLRTFGRALGAVGLAYGVVSDGSSLYSQYQISQQTGNYGNTYQEGARIAGGWGGALIAGEAGAASGAVIGAALGSIVPILGNGVGAAVGGFVGGVFGAFVGYNAGSAGGTALYQEATGG